MADHEDQEMTMDQSDNGNPCRPADDSQDARARLSEKVSDIVDKADLASQLHALILVCNVVSGNCQKLSEEHRLGGQRVSQCAEWIGIICC